MRPVALACLCLGVLAACARPVARIDEPTAAPLPAGDYAEAAREGAAVFRIDPGRSLILVRVGRAGSMRKLGHDHAIASTDVQGFIALFDDIKRSRADVVFPLRNLRVDEPRHRERLGLDAGPDESDIAGTYTNMLKVLEPELAPWARLAARVAAGETGATELRVTIGLHGRERALSLPLDFERDGPRLVARGSATLTHQAFGLEPYSAAGGLLRVADELEVRFEFIALETQSN
ncbi:MAG: YceI family protein [Woeseiaceae bacterium]|nr:YceI family protein [Woeseiaceae bacterium]